VAQIDFVAGDVSTRDYFHPSLAGQQKLAAVSWDVGPFGSGATIGGRNFMLETNGTMSWTSGTRQSAYVIARLFSATGNSYLPPGGALPATAVSYVDSAPANGFVCYVLIAFRGAEALGNSDLLCRADQIASGTAPRNFRVGLGGSGTATLTWNPPGGQTAYALFTVDGALTRTFDGTATAAAIPVSALTCWVLVAFNGSLALGNTDAICAYPGFSSFTSSGLSGLQLAGPAR